MSGLPGMTRPSSHTDVLAVGEGPANYADFFSQQKRWAYGIWEVVRHHSPRLLPKMRSNKQRLAYMTLQNHYPTTAIAWVAAILLNTIYLIGGVGVTRLPLTIWTAVFVPGMILAFGLIQFMRRFNLADHERKSWGLHGMALELITGPVFVVAAAAQVAGRRLAYVVTPKGSAATPDGLKSFRGHLGWATVAGSSIATGIVFGHGYWTFYFWAGTVMLICMTPIAILVSKKAYGAVRRVRLSSEAQREQSTVPALAVAAGSMPFDVRRSYNYQGTRDEGAVPARLASKRSVPGVS